MTWRYFVRGRFHSFGLARNFLVLFVVCTAFGCIAPAQMSQAAIERVEMLHSQIKSAEGQHAADAQLGALWLRLANVYEDQLQFAEAEGAFARSLRLLRTSGPQAAYADALDGMGSLYLDTGRLSEAGNYVKKSLALFESLGNRAATARLHETMALVLIFGHKFRESEMESAESIREGEAEARADKRELTAAYLTHGYAICYLGRCSAALEDTNRAMTISQAAFPANSMEMAGAWLARGFEFWKSGSPDEGARAMQQALKLVRSRTDLPRTLFVSEQLGVMREYDELLKATHRKPEAVQIESEIARLESEQRLACNGCTVSVATLMPGPLLR